VRNALGAARATRLGRRVFQAVCHYAVDGGKPLGLSKKYTQRVRNAAENAAFVFRDTNLAREDRREKMRIFCNLIGRHSSASKTVQLLKEITLALGIAIGAEGLAKITEGGLALLGGAPWPIR
jgi:hypothetical protein